jgi:hypothetical protein
VSDADGFQSDIVYFKQSASVIDLENTSVLGPAILGLIKNKGTLVLMPGRMPALILGKAPMIAINLKWGRDLPWPGYGERRQRDGHEARANRIDRLGSGIKKRPPGKA